MIDQIDLAQLQASISATFEHETYRARYLYYIENLNVQDLPPILSFSHLADILSIDKSRLRELVFRTQHFYSDFSIPKRTGGLRQISVPYSELATIQKWIAEKILAPATRHLIRQVIGYVPKKSLMCHVAPHLNSECVAKFDLKDFFPSISTTYVTRLFMDMGYTTSVARVLTGLVTKDGCLPQGACTSPQLSNMYLASFDTALAKFCSEFAFEYTRYADDIVISGDKNILSELNSIRKIFFDHRLVINESKTQIYRERTDVRFITGLMIQNGRVRLPKSMRRQIRCEVHGLKRAILELKNQHQFKNCNIGLGSDPVFIDRILGKLNYWSQIEPDDLYPRTVSAEIDELLSGFR